ncbi:MAG: hypothetical protein HN741_07340, partial [Anaerolineae bacterium]|nr:hypothetical protein [Anaerolineae bacterium]
MSEARLRSLMLSGITALKTGELNSARNYFERALYTARDHDLLADLWFYMSEIESDEAKKRNALDEALSYRMTHARARRSLAILNGTLKVGEIVDSNTIIAPTASERETNADRFECPSCAGIMSFSPDGETLICDFCTTKDKTESNHSENQEQDFFSTMATLRGHSKPISRKVFHCE